MQTLAPAAVALAVLVVVVSTIWVALDIVEIRQRTEDLALRRPPDVLFDLLLEPIWSGVAGGSAAPARPIGLGGERRLLVMTGADDEQSRSWWSEFARYEEENAVAGSQLSLLHIVLTWPGGPTASALQPAFVVSSIDPEAFARSSGIVALPTAAVLKGERLLRLLVGRPTPTDGQWLVSEDGGTAGSSSFWRVSGDNVLVLRGTSRRSSSIQKESPLK